MNHSFLKIVFAFLSTLLSLNISAQKFQAYAYKASHNSQWTRCNRMIEIRKDFDEIILEVYWSVVGGEQYYLSKKIKEGEDYIIMEAYGPNAEKFNVAITYTSHDVILILKSNRDEFAYRMRGISN